MRITTASDRVWDSQTALLARDGSFQFKNIPVGKCQIFASVRGYRHPTIDTTMDKDIDGFEMVLDPAKAL